MALTFTGTSAAKPVVAAIEALKRMDAEGRRKVPADAPLDFLPAEWREAIDGRRRTPPNTSGNSAWPSKCANTFAPPTFRFQEVDNTRSGPRICIHQRPGQSAKPVGSRDFPLLR